MSNSKNHAVYTDEEARKVKKTVSFILSEYYVGFIVVIAFALLFPAALSTNIYWMMGLAFLTVTALFLPYFGLVPRSGSLEPLDNGELKRLKMLAQAHVDILEWVRPAAAAGFVFRMRDLEAAEEVAGAVEDQALLLEEPAERQSIYEELAGRTYEADEK
ncbi:hypothetical protein P2A78_20690 [Xanthomonas perforans]|uniref:Transmembrane protein n=2 Tax=Xanthomonas hortorum TaxID=56454 RepID=A0A6V7FHX6_9XANT|nr:MULTISPECIES: hypothetical protein [Xanthomonas]APP82591.1 hypothetical protein BJD10_23175 [Xanthomonas hortorum pv. gardneri]KLB02903.1 hypothetical protein SM17710_01610 [Xanthomonas hortorum pv. gardneri]KLB06757.1 hypothetical protein SM18210_00640 [Xanthomonas hortorum pv. gardneri]KLB12048.1 hypothetical protein SM23410_03875 [Xanthomonas hortorum pv. gardneri]KLB14288.1 hypothetical protein SM22010_01385 [Xanthomonas hortorum pv. gardneri]